MVTVMMAEDDLGGVGQVDAQLGGVSEHGLGARSGIEEQAMAVGLHQRGEAPFADPPVVGQHRREDGDLERADSRAGAGARLLASDRGGGE